MTSSLVSGRLIRRALAAGPLASALGLLAPSVAQAHQLTERYSAPLPLAAYVLGAAFAVTLSFVFVMLRDARPPTEQADRPTQV
ncbi:MAG: hypothetical protein ABIP53_05510, partial [Candidatus Limnocylindrales bacterium]